MASLDMHQLKCFITVAEEGHVGRAASRLHMTQPPLTRRINRLERDLGVRLFHRSATGMALTDPGLVLLERARRIVSLSQHTVEHTRLADAGHAGNFVVGYFGSTIFDAVPRLLRGFLKDHPEVNLRLERAPKNLQADALRDGRMHVGFGRLYRDEPGLVVRHIRKEPLYVAIPTEHALVECSEIRIEQLRDVSLVLFPASARPSFADEVSQMCMQAGFALDAAQEAEDVVTALAYVASSGLCAVVPRSATTIGLPGVAYRSLVDAPLQELSCLYRADDPQPLLGAFLSYLDAEWEV